MEIGAFIDMSNRAETPGELFTQFRGAMAAKGFDRILFALMTDHVTINRPAQHGFMCNYPLDWIKFYLERRYEAVDPVRQYIYLAETAFTWESMPHRLQLTKPQRECLSQARAAGLQDGIGVPLRGPRARLRASAPPAARVAPMCRTAASAASASCRSISMRPS